MILEVGEEIKVRDVTAEQGKATRSLISLLDLLLKKRNPVKHLRMHRELGSGDMYQLYVYYKARRR